MTDTIESLRAERDAERVANAGLREALRTVAETAIFAIEGLHVFCLGGGGCVCANVLPALYEAAGRPPFSMAELDARADVRFSELGVSMVCNDCEYPYPCRCRGPSTMAPMPSDRPHVPVSLDTGVDGVTAVAHVAPVMSVESREAITEIASAAARALSAAPPLREGGAPVCGCSCHSEKCAACGCTVAQRGPSIRDVAAYLLDRADQYDLDSGFWIALADAAKNILHGEVEASERNGDFDADLYARVDAIQKRRA